MVNPSPKLTMKQSSRLLQFFKSFHQPQLPLNPRESKKLLNLLTTTFRQQLDKDHGEFRKDNLFPLPMKKTPDTITRRRSFSEPLPPTERHFQAILLDPLFNNRIGPGEKHLSRNPMDIFELAVSKGLMTVDKCRTCLLAEKRSILRSPKPTIWEGMRDSGAGLKVLRWLKANGLTETGQYLTQDGLFSVLSEFVVAEGLQEAVWHDFIRQYSSLDTKNIVAGKVLLCMVAAETKGPHSLDGGISALLRASTILQDSPDYTQRLVLRPSALMLSFHCTALSQSYPKPRPSNHADLLRIINKTTKAKKLHSALLYLHHPTRPSPQTALEFFRKLPNDLDNAAEYPAKSVIRLGLDTARYLLEHERVEEARGIMDTLQTSFPDELGKNGSQTLRHAKSEAWNLELLQGLKFA